MSLVDRIAAALAPCGLNQVGVASVLAYDAVASPALRSAVLLPGAGGIIVVGSGGSALWRAFLDDLRVDSRGLVEWQDPLDHFVAQSIARAHSALLGVRHRWFLAGDPHPPFVDLRTLAVLAGLGARSRLGLVCSPVCGPWLGLRAACFVETSLPASQQAPDICEGCSSPCLGACPGDAFVDGQWQVARCAAFHQRETTCRGICHARLACPVGAEHAYPDLERQYHDDRERGRAALRRHLGIAAQDDPYQGEGPDWNAWS